MPRNFKDRQPNDFSEGALVFELTQAMGGGRIHLMVALGLLARHENLRPEVLAADINDRLDFGKARIAAFNSTQHAD